MHTRWHFSCSHKPLTAFSCARTGSGDPLKALEVCLGGVGWSLGGFCRIADCSRLGFTGRGEGTRRTLEPSTGGAARNRAHSLHARLAPRLAAASRALRVTPYFGPRVRGRPRQTAPLRLPGPPAETTRRSSRARQRPTAWPRGQEAGPESPGARARHGRPLLIGRPRLSRAGRTGIGAARGQSWSNWTPGGGSQSRSLRGWRQRRAQSPGWESGRDARTMPYLLISTQIRMVSTRRPASWMELGPGPGRGGRDCTLAPPSRAAPASDWIRKPPGTRPLRPTS